jgi:hypothetical protein
MFPIRIESPEGETEILIKTAFKSVEAIFEFEYLDNQSASSACPGGTIHEIQTESQRQPFNEDRQLRVKSDHQAPGASLGETTLQEDPQGQIQSFTIARPKFRFSEAKIQAR